MAAAEPQERRSAAAWMEVNGGGLLRSDWPSSFLTDHLSVLISRHVLTGRSADGRGEAGAAPDETDDKSFVHN